MLRLSVVLIAKERLSDKMFVSRSRGLLENVGWFASGVLQASKPECDIAP